MHTQYLIRILNVGLRCLTLGARFLLIFFLAKFLKPDELGLYGLLVAAVGYALYLLGLDFYSYTTRELLKHEKGQWGALLKNQAVLTMILYCVCLPLLMLIFINGSLPWKVAGWFFFLLILEHLNQEAMRLLIAASEPFWANIVLFLRLGSWALAVVVVMFLKDSMRNLEFVLSAWMLGGGLALLLAMWRFVLMRTGGWKQRVDWQWIAQGIKVALPLLVATLAVRGVFTFDRYWLESLAGLEVLGAYVLFISLANAMGAFLEAGVFAFIYPELIKAYQQADTASFRIGMRRLWQQTTALIAVFSLAATGGIGSLLNWLGRPLYHEYAGLFPWVLLAIALYQLSMIAHYGLYAQRRDGPIIYSHIAALLVFVPVTWLLLNHWSALAVPMGMCAAFSLMLVWKTIAYLWLTPVQYRYNDPASGV